MDLRQLRYFLTVAEELHFGRAAERLAMTQPPLSQAIQALEAELGVKLFARTKRHVALTPVGREWLAHARRVFEDASALPEIARRLSRGEAGLLRLAFVSTADYSLLPGLVSLFRDRFPAVELALLEMTSDLQIEALLEEKVDVGMVIASSRTSLPGALDYRPLLREPLVAAVPAAWTEQGRAGFAEPDLPVDALMAAPLILFPRRSAPAFHDIVSGYYAAHGAALPVRQEAIQMQTIISLVAAGMGLALVPRSLQRLQRQGVRYLALRDAAPVIETGLAWRHGDRSPALRRFLDVVEKEALGKEAV
ncbi:LysR family transcriptional regulator [Labrys okinawensis]|uniref:LysR family transcriptional regulator n=1 Tax=Labrys okinawensis TaxID=346911 RepID=A0A2S9Q9F8_9HYPH|nr:LysR family transcriptional regulator [Labrys okinawensis]PRH85977.1 LysR family transcriptional regulator [Labrys okinawensis]